MYAVAQTPMYLQPDELRGSFTDPQGTVDFTKYNNASVVNLIQQASIKIDGLCQQTFMLTNVCEHHMGRGTNFLHARCWPIWGGLWTALTAPVNPGDTSIHVADATGLIGGGTLNSPINLIQGQYVNIQDAVQTGNQELQKAIHPSYTPGSLTVPFTTAMAYSHSPGTNIWVYGVDTIQIVLPQQAFAIPSSVLVVQNELGIIQNYTPLMFQQLGYSTIFPKDVPLLLHYTYGYPTGYFPFELKQVCLELCIATVLARRYQQAGNVASESSEDISISYFKQSDISEFTKDQVRMLGKFIRGRLVA